MSSTQRQPAVEAGWHHQRMAAFDVESTGTDYEWDRIVTASLAVVGGGAGTHMRSWLLNPGVEIPEAVSAVHGVTTERARAEGVEPGAAIEQIVAALAEEVGRGVPIVAFNARFDLTMLDREARRHGVVPLADRTRVLHVVDPFVLDKQVDRYRRGKRTLGALCARRYLDDAHDADADALAAARLAWRIAEVFPEIGRRSLSELHQQQIEWAAEQAASLEDYFRRIGRDERCERAWPIVPAPAAVAA